MCTTHECEHCMHVFNSRNSLLAHQRRARYCLELQGQTNDDMFECDYCPRKFTLKQHLTTHILSCKERKKTDDKEKDILIVKLRDEIKQLTSHTIKLESDLKVYETELKVYKEQAERATACIETIAQQPKSISNNKNNVVNTYIEKLEILSTDSMKTHLPNLTLEHVNNGPKGYATFALEGPFKDKVVCTDISRKILKYRDENKLIQTDQGGIALGKKFFQTVQPRSIEILMKEQEEISNNTEIDAEDRLAKMMEIAKEIISIKSISRGDKEGEEYREDFTKYVSSGTVIAK